MPRNYSIKDTIQQAKDAIHQKKMQKLQDQHEPKMTPTFPYRDYEDKEKIIKFTPPKDDIVKFDNDKIVEETDTKKWYQFWK